LSYLSFVINYNWSIIVKRLKFGIHTYNPYRLIAFISQNSPWLLTALKVIMSLKQVHYLESRTVIRKNSLSNWKWHSFPVHFSLVSPRNQVFLFHRRKKQLHYYHQCWAVNFPKSKLNFFLHNAVSKCCQQYTGLKIFRAGYDVWTGST
jgi:hypothetical protein